MDDSQKGSIICFWYQRKSHALNDDGLRRILPPSSHEDWNFERFMTSSSAHATITDQSPFSSISTVSCKAIQHAPSEQFLHKV